MSMNLIDDIATIIRTTPVENIDWSFVQKLNVMRAYEGFESKSANRVLIETLLLMLSTTSPKDRAIAVILGAHEDMVRHIVQKAVRARLLELRVDQLQEVAVEDAILRKREELAGLDKQLQAHSRGKNNMQFKAHLRYAAEKWGNTQEKKAVEAIIKKIPDERATHVAAKI